MIAIYLHLLLIFRIKQGNVIEVTKNVAALILAHRHPYLSM